MLRRELSEAAQKDMQLWTGCIAGALLEGDYRRRLAAAGFTDIEVEPTRIYAKVDMASLREVAELDFGGLR